MEHLYFTKVDNPVCDRRKRTGFPPRTENKNYVRHGETLLSQIEHNMNENRNDIERLQFNPNLVMKVNLEEGAILSEDHISKLESMGLRVIDTEEKELMVLFADDYELKEFKKVLNNYKNGVIAKTKVENEDLFSAVASISRWDIEDRKGQELEKLLSIDYIDCYLWIFDSITETKQKAEEFIEEAEQYAIKICDKYISQSVVVVRLKIEKENLSYYLKNPLVYRIDKKPNYNIKKSEREYLQYSLGDFQYNNDHLHDDSPAICVIDSGILSGHPLLKDTIADAKVFYVTEGYSPNENDIAGHGTMVAGICEYGKINSDITFVPHINLYSAKIHDGEYIGDYNLCVYELQAEGINLSFEQDELLYKYFQGELTVDELFDLLNLKKRINEIKSIVRKHTNAQEKLIPNQMREIVEYFYNNYRCRIFNLSQGDLNYPYDDKKPRAWTIDVDKTHIFELPIPKEFEKAKGKKKIIISLAFNPDVRKTRMDYLGKTMSFELIRGQSLDEVYQVYASQAGLPKEDKKEKFQDRFVCKMNNCGKEMREHGTLQRGIFEFSRSPYNDNYYLVVDCKKNWSTKKTRLRSSGYI